MQCHLTLTSQNDRMHPSNLLIDQTRGCPCNLSGCRPLAPRNQSHSRIHRIGDATLKSTINHSCAIAAKDQVWEAYQRKSLLPTRMTAILSLASPEFVLQNGALTKNWHVNSPNSSMCSNIDINLTSIETPKALWPLGFQSCNFQHVKCHVKVLTFTNLSMEAHTSGMENTDALVQI